MTGGIQFQKVPSVVHVLDQHAALHRHRGVGFTVESDEDGSRCCISVSDAPVGTAAITRPFRRARASDASRVGAG